jgi:ABC-type uncharacterized transport system auxiliary subunit
MHPSGEIDPAVNLDVDRIRSSEALSRPRILVQISPTRVEYYAHDEWVGPLHELVAQKLEAEFGEGDESVPALEITGDLLAFEQVDITGGANARVKLAVAFWPVGDHNDTPLMANVYEKQVPSGATTPAAVVEALSRALEAVAADIARDAARLR